MRIPYALGLFLGGVVVQWWWTTYLPIHGAAPQLLLVMTIAIASLYGPVVGQCFGFSWGLFLDVLGVHLFGAHALLMTLVGYLVGMGRRQMDVSTPLSQTVMTVLLTAVYFALSSVVGIVFQRQAFWSGWGMAVAIPVYNGLLAPILFGFAEKAAPMPRL